MEIGASGGQGSLIVDLVIGFDPDDNKLTNCLQDSSIERHLPAKVAVYSSQVDCISLANCNLMPILTPLTGRFAFFGIKVDGNGGLIRQLSQGPLKISRLLSCSGL